MRDQVIYAVGLLSSYRKYNRTCPGRPYTVPLLSAATTCGVRVRIYEMQHTILIAEHFPKYHGDNFWTLEQTR